MSGLPPGGSPCRARRSASGRVHFAVSRRTSAISRRRSHGHARIRPAAPGSAGSTGKSPSENSDIGARMVPTHGSPRAAATAGVQNVSGWLTSTSAPDASRNVSS